MGIWGRVLVLLGLRAPILTWAAEANALLEAAHQTFLSQSPLLIISHASRQAGLSAGSVASTSQERALVLFLCLPPSATTDTWGLAQSGLGMCLGGTASLTPVLRPRHWLSTQKQ